MKRLLVALAVGGLFSLAVAVPGTSAQSYGPSTPYGYPGYGSYGAVRQYSPYGSPFYATGGYGSPTATLGAYGGATSPGSVGGSASYSGGYPYYNTGGYPYLGAYGGYPNTIGSYGGYPLYGGFGYPSSS